MAEKFYRVVAKHKFEGNDILFTYEDKAHFVKWSIKLPELEDYDELTFYYKDEENDEKSSTVSFKWVKKMCSEIEEPFTKEEKEEGKDLIEIESDIWGTIYFDKKKPMEIKFEDVTEEDLFDFYSIKDSIINDREHGLWAFHGLRKFRFYFENIQDTLVEDCDELQKSAILVFNKKDTTQIPEIRMENIWTTKNKDSNEFFAYIDTNILGKEFEDNTHRMQFLGSFEITYSWESKENYIEKYSFPVKIVLNNTNYYPNEQITCTPLDTTPVSIDFGTSSTCVAVKNGKEIELLTLSSEELEANDSSVNRFENPTNIMIYRWERIYEQWKNENQSLPLFLKGDRDDEKFKKKEVEFDFGYKVNDVLEDAQNIELNSVLTQIKLIPYYIEQGFQMELNPLIKKEIDVIKLVSSPEEENIECFDPIAFYGYLLGRAINNPRKGKIYTKFDIAYPVKFNTEVRKKLKTSLEYGLKRSLPLPLRESKDKNGRSLVSVNMKYSEPVAYIGAICGKYLKIENNRPELFAVYDFGGGTLDFSFGMFRIDEDGDPIIEIFGVDGNEKIGGESLISLISFWIYTAEANKKQMIDKCIPFEIPLNEKIPEDFPEKLLNKSGIAKANIRKINELFGRKLFENNNDGAETVDVDLFTESNDIETINISVDYDILKGNLTEILEKTIKDFYVSIKTNFERNKNLLDKYYGEFNVKNVNIFKSGNASRNLVLEEKMKNYFSENNIYLIDESEKGGNKRYAITPKTAVAFGQLRLRGFVVNESKETPFKWYVYNENKANGNLSMILHKNDNDNVWKKFGSIYGDVIDLHYSDTPASSEDNYYTMQVETNDLGNEFEKADFYIRVYDETSIEYCVCDKGQKPNNEDSVNKNCLIELKLN